MSDATTAHSTMTTGVDLEVGGHSAGVSKGRATRLGAMIALLLALLGLAPGCAGPSVDAPAQPGAQPLVVLSYNIHHGEGVDGVFDLARLAQLIVDSGADLVALQEVDVGTSRASGVDQAAELGRLSGMHVAFGRAIDFAGGQYGDAVLSRWPIEGVQRIALPAAPDHELRVAVAVTVSPPDGGLRLRFVSTHLDHTTDPADRVAQVGELNARLLPAALPTLLVGDLNAQPDSKPMARLLDAGWLAADGDLAPTYPSDMPERKIDWVLLAPGSVGRVGEARVLHEPVASDHCPLLARWWPEG